MTAVVLLAAACGEDDDGSASPGTSDAAAAGATASGGPVSGERLRAASGDAPAVRAVLGEAPGPAGRTPLEGFGETAVAITAPDGGLLGWCVLVALEETQRQRGLMEVTDLGGYAGMLFVFEGDTNVGFYMRDTPMPLSIAWFDAEGRLVSTADMDPCGDVDDCPVTYPDGRYRFALEVPQGGLRDLGLGETSRLAVDGRCADRRR